MDNPSDNPDDEIVVRLDPLIAGIVGGFLVNRRDDATAIFDALEASNMEAVDQIGHDLEGTAGAFGFTGMAEIGHSLQQSAKQSSHEDIKRLGEGLVSYLDRLRIVYD